MATPTRDRVGDAHSPQRFRTLDAVNRAIVACERCPRLRAHCLQVASERKRRFADEVYWGRPVPGFGDPHARVHIVGLAPAAHGGNRTGRVFTGDSSGNWLYAALHRHGFANQPDSSGRDDGLVLRDVWISAAARCAPPANKPTRDELASCRLFLTAEIGLLPEVRVVLLLGRIAWQGWLEASGWWTRLPARERPPFAHGAESRLPDGAVVICSYHPSRQNTNTGTLTPAMWEAVFRRVRDLVDDRPARGARNGG